MGKIDIDAEIKKLRADIIDIDSELKKLREMTSEERRIHGEYINSLAAKNRETKQENPNDKNRTS